MEPSMGSFFILIPPPWFYPRTRADLFLADPSRFVLEKITPIRQSMSNSRESLRII